mgnify:CR=1 FL=1
MISALYGVFVILNTQTAAFLDLYFSVLFAIPALIGSFKNRGKGIGMAVLCMAMLTMLFAPVTSWPRQLANLFAGAVFGWGLCRDKSPAFCFTVSFVLCALSDYLCAAVLFKAAGLSELASDPIFQFASGWLNLRTLAACYAILTGLLEAFLVLCLSQIILMRWFRKRLVALISLQPVKPAFFTVTMLVLLILTGLLWEPFASKGSVQILLGSLLFLNYLILDYNGFWFLLSRRPTKPPFWLIFLLVIGWALPPLSFFFTMIGLGLGIVHLFKRG